MEAIYYESSLCHHGIKGQKWGVRRYRNEDGSLTPAGKKHYSDSRESVESKKKLSTKQKVAIGAGVGVTVAATVLAVYGGIKYKDFVKQVATKEMMKTADQYVFPKSRPENSAEIADRVRSIKMHVRKTHIDLMSFRELNEVARPKIEKQIRVIKKIREHNRSDLIRTEKAYKAKRITDALRYYMKESIRDLKVFTHEPGEIAINAGVYRDFNRTNFDLLKQRIKKYREQPVGIIKVPKMRDLVK